MVDDCAGADLVHSHTWYANMAGHLAGLMHGIPHVVSAHSLEPMRPWKAEQLGGGYAAVELGGADGVRGAAGIIAVSAAMRDDVLRSYPAVDPSEVHVVHNGIDTTAGRPVSDPDRVRELGVDPDRPSVIFVGRITRQKGLPLFLRAAAELPPDVQLMLCAGAPDTPEIEAEVRGLVDGLAAGRDGVVWIDEMLPRADVVALLSRPPSSPARRSTSRSASSTSRRWPARPRSSPPRRAASPRWCVHGETGWLVPIEQATDGTGTPLAPEQYVADLAAALNDAVSDPERARAYGVAGRARAQEAFSWGAIAARTLDLYRSVGA